MSNGDEAQGARQSLQDRIARARVQRAIVLESKRSVAPQGNEPPGIRFMDDPSFAPAERGRREDSPKTATEPRKRGYGWVAWVGCLCLVAGVIGYGIGSGVFNFPRPAGAVAEVPFIVAAPVPVRRAARAEGEMSLATSIPLVPLAATTKNSVSFVQTPDVRRLSAEDSADGSLRYLDAKLERLAAEAPVSTVAAISSTGEMRPRPVAQLTVVRGAVLESAEPQEPVLLAHSVSDLAPSDLAILLPGEDVIALPLDRITDLAGASGEVLPNLGWTETGQDPFAGRAMRLAVHLPERAGPSRVNSYREKLDILAMPDLKLSPVPVTVGASHVRFFYESDKEIALALAETTGWEARDFTHLSRKPPETSLEVWLQGSGSPIEEPEVERRGLGRLIAGLESSLDRLFGMPEGR